MATQVKPNGVSAAKITNGNVNDTDTLKHQTNGYKPSNPTRLFPSSPAPSVEELKAICHQTTSPETFPLAATVQSNIPIYDMSRFAGQADSGDLVEQLKEEWYQCIRYGPGVIVLQRFFDPPSYQEVLESINTTIDAIIAEEGKAHGLPAGSTPHGKVHNSLRKLAVATPETFSEYFSNPWLAHVSDTWLGPAYRITAQVNIVRPSGKAQSAHRDYHMGYFPPEDCVKYPRDIQYASQFLTLQGAVAHSDMPLESGPTRFLPYSQLYDAGYLAHRRPEFQHHFLDNYVSLPLRMGDAVFFNPAILHGAGENTTTAFDRRAQLLQLNSCFSKTMEDVNSMPIITATWDVLASWYKRDGGLSQAVECLIRAVADGHVSPTNLDRTIGHGNGFAMNTEQHILRQALKEGWNKDEVLKAVKFAQWKRVDGPLAEE